MKGDEKQKKLRRCQGYFAEDILQFEKERKIEEEKAEKEKEEQKKEVAETRKRKRDEKEKEKQERMKEREEKRARKMEENTKKMFEREAKECKAKCGSHWRKGTGWSGCEYCETFWVCPQCWKLPKTKRQLKMHERECMKQ